MSDQNREIIKREIAERLQWAAGRFSASSVPGEAIARLVAEGSPP